jgi:small subunit ribosomal protein S17
MATAIEGQAIERERRHTMQGTVVSDKASKTRVVVVERTVRHAQYGKTLRRSSKFYVHDEREESKEGDFVEIAGTRPLSKLKRWRLVRVVKAAPRPAAKEGES